MCATSTARAPSTVNCRRSFLPAPVFNSWYGLKSSNGNPYALCRPPNLFVIHLHVLYSGNCRSARTHLADERFQSCFHECVVYVHLHQICCKHDLLNMKILRNSLCCFQKALCSLAFLLYGLSLFHKHPKSMHSVHDCTLVRQYGRSPTLACLNGDHHSVTSPLSTRNT